MQPLVLFFIKCFFVSLFFKWIRLARLAFSGKSMVLWFSVRNGILQAFLPLLIIGI